VNQAWPVSGRGSGHIGAHTLGFGRADGTGPARGDRGWRRCYSRCHSRCDSPVLVGHAPYDSRRALGGRHGLCGARLSVPK